MANAITALLKLSLSRMLPSIPHASDTASTIPPFIFFQPSFHLLDPIYQPIEISLMATDYSQGGIAAGPGLAWMLLGYTLYAKVV